MTENIVPHPETQELMVDVTLSPELNRIDAQILVEIYSNDGDPMRQTDVAQEIGVHKSRISERAENLESMKLLKREKKSGKYGETFLHPVSKSQ